MLLGDLSAIRAQRYGINSPNAAVGIEELTDDTND